MKLYLLLILFVSITLSTSAQNESPMKTLTSEKGLSCKLTTKELQQRKKTVVADLKKLLLERTETEKGYNYKFSSSDSMLDLLNDFIKTERMCCDFFTFQITVDGEFAWLELSGPAGTKEFIQEELEL